MADEPEIEVQIEDNQSPTTQVEVPSEKAATEPKSDPVAVLKAQVETAQAERERERQGRQEADRQAQADRAARAAAERDVETARSEISETRLSSVDAGIAAANAEIAAAENDSIAAQEAGDWKRNTEAVKRLARAEATRMRLEEAKSDLESQRQEGDAGQRRAEPPSAQSADPIEAFIAGRASATQTWLRAHPEQARALAMTMAGRATVDEQRRSAKVNAAHNDALGDGLSPDTPEYFAHVEEFLGMNKKEPEPAKTAEAPKKAAALVAPVSSADGGAVNGSSSVVKLSQREAVAAQDGTLIWNYPDPTGKNRWKKGEPIGIQEMARRKREGMKQGLYDKTWLEQ